MMIIFMAELGLSISLVYAGQIKIKNSYREK